VGKPHHLATKIPWPGPIWLLFLGSPQEFNLWDLCVSRRWYGSYNFSSMWKYSTCQGSLTECIGTWFIASVPIMELVVASLNPLCELKIIPLKILHNVQPISSMKMKWKI
jgi:hypothetical protein